MSAAIVAFGAVSAMGEGAAAASAGIVGERARLCLQRDEELTAAGLARPFAARVSGLPPGDRATAILLRAARMCTDDLDVALPEWRSLRVGLALGTSSGGMRSAELLYASYLRPELPQRSRDEVADAFYFGPMLTLVGALGLTFEPSTLVMGACAASTLALGVGLRWLASDACDLVLAGGFDAVSTFVAAGFEALRATASTLPPRPFRLGRDGMGLGEGAAIVAMRPSRLAPRAEVHVVGFGASSDAVHLTAPDRTGRGLARAAKAALDEAGLSRIDLVSPHGSATPFSDAAEVQALAAAIPEIAEQVVVHPFKAQIGHTLGASGVLETLACVDALRRGVYPAAAGEGEVDPDSRVTLLDVTRAGTPRTALKLSAAFGGVNAALVVSRDASSSSPRPLCPVYVRAAVHLSALPSSGDLAARVGWPIERMQRAEPLARWVLGALADLVARDGSLSGAGIVVGESFATVETNAAFFTRMRERGLRMAEPRKFPYTSPNAAAGDAGVAFDLTGPSFAVGSGLHSGLEAFVVAARLVAAGDAETMVVVAVDEVGPTVSRMAETLGVSVSSGAVALVLSAHPGLAVAKVEHASCGAGPQPSTAPVTCGHRALLPLVGGPIPRILEASSPDFATQAAAAWARVELALMHRIDATPAGS